MFLVGLTAGIACGKSTVSKMFTDLDVPVIDMDYLARKVVEPGRKAWRNIRKTFGDAVIQENGELDRKVLGQIIFQDANKRKKLNQITHPEIAKEVAFLIFRYCVKGHQFVIIDSPLLFEVNTWLRLVHKVVVISCDEQVQLQRLRKRDNFTEEDALARINSQMPTEEKRKRADFIVHNNGSLSETQEQVVRILTELRSSKYHWVVRLGLFSFAGLCGSLVYFAFRFLN